MFKDLLHDPCAVKAVPPPPKLCAEAAGGASVEPALGPMQFRNELPA